MQWRVCGEQRTDPAVPFVQGTAVFSVMQSLTKKGPSGWAALLPRARKQTHWLFHYPGKKKGDNTLEWQSSSCGGRDNC